MEILLEEFYKTDLIVEKYHDRKTFIDEKSYHIRGVTHTGKTKLVKNYLLTLKKSTYLYIDCNDTRIDIDLLNKSLPSFINKNKIYVLALDNYTNYIDIPNISQLLLISQKKLNIDFLDTIIMFPLDYEEFLAFEHKYDSTALNHFFQLGGFTHMHKIASDSRNISLQNILRVSLNEVEFDIVCICAKFVSLKLSPYNIYERLKLYRKISKDKLYRSFQELVDMGYIHILEKFNSKKAIKKVYLCDISLKSALSIEKNFAKLFENMIYLELLKSSTQCYYDDDIDFYIPKNNEIILCKPFVDERRLFKKLESIEAFIFTHSITNVTVITMNKEGSISHPLSKIDIIPFDIWALGD